MKRGVVPFVFAFVLGISGLATAGILSAGGSHPAGAPDKEEANEQDTGVHGGRATGQPAWPLWGSLRLCWP